MAHWAPMQPQKMLPSDKHPLWTLPSHNFAIANIALASPACPAATGSLLTCYVEAWENICSDWSVGRLILHKCGRTAGTWVTTHTDTPAKCVPVEQLRRMDGRSDSTQYMDAKDLQSSCLDEERAWQIALVYLTSGLVAAVFPATAGNEEIGSHQNMQARSSSAHLSKDHRQGKHRIREIKLWPDKTNLWSLLRNVF